MLGTDATKKESERNLPTRLHHGLMYTLRGHIYNYLKAEKQGISRKTQLYKRLRPFVIHLLHPSAHSFFNPNCHGLENV